LRDHEIVRALRVLLKEQRTQDFFMKPAHE
jgi:hypothetical protein